MNTSAPGRSAQIPEMLKTRLRASNVIPFVGAGVSMAVKRSNDGRTLFPSWKQLLLSAADRLEQEQKASSAAVIRAVLEKPDYLYAAKEARDGLHSLLYELLKEKINRPRSEVDESSLALARAVWELGSRLVITTNYDRVLRWGCPQSADVEEWDINATAEQSAFLRRGVNQPTIWHLHGQIGNATKLILTPDGYSRLYPDKETESKYPDALQTLRSCLASYTFLFIGFSLDDEHFGAQLQAVTDLYQDTTGPHYVLAKESHCERIKAARPEIEVLPFADFGEPLLNLVQSLGEAAKQGVAQTSGADASPLKIGDHTAEVNKAYDITHPPFFVPFAAKGDQVIGRDDALLEVRRRLEAGRRTAIGQAASFQGLGGLGKTQLAVEYAYKYRASYPNGVIWITADQDIPAQLIRLCDEAKWLAPQSEHRHKLEVARNRLRSYSDCLIVFDNLDEMESIWEYLPLPQASPHILITTRYEFAEFTPLPLDPLNKELSLKLLLQEADRQPATEDDWNAARGIAESLGGLPLALELAGAYLRHRPIGWKQYFDLLQQSLKAALPGKLLASFTRHDTDLYSTLRVNDDVLSEEPYLREIIDLLTWSASAPMGVELMRSLLGLSNALDLAGALSLGVALRLLHKTPEQESYALHRLVGQVRREELSLTEYEQWVNDICCRAGDWFEAIKLDFTQLPAYEAEMDHLRAWHELAVRHAKDHAARLLWLQSYPDYHHGRYKEIKELMERAQRLMREMQIKNEALEANILADSGFSSGKLGDHHEALKGVVAQIGEALRERRSGKLFV